MWIKKDLNEKHYYIFARNKLKKNTKFFIAVSLRPAKTLWNSGNDEGQNFTGLLVYVLPLILITPWTTMKSRAQKYSFKTVVHLLTINGFIILRNNCPIICVSRNCPVLTRVLRNLKTKKLKQIASRCTLHKIDRNIMDTIFKPKIIT